MDTPKRYYIQRVLKTKVKDLSVCQSMLEAKHYAETTGLKFVELAYMGGFPIYADAEDRYYRITKTVVIGSDNKEVVVSPSPEETRLFI